MLAPSLLQAEAAVPQVCRFLLIRHGEEQRVAVIRAELGHHPGGKREAAGKHKAGLERN